MTKEHLEAIRERVLEETTGIPVDDILGPNPGAAASWIEDLLSDRAALLEEVDRLTGRRDAQLNQSPITTSQTQEDLVKLGLSYLQADDMTTEEKLALRNLNQTRIKPQFRGN